MFGFLSGKKTEDYKMVDMHCHILPGVDDGSQDVDESLEMLRIAEKSGIEKMILTPHYKESHHNASIETLRSRLDELKVRASQENINVKLALGNEVMYFSDFQERYEQGKILTLNGTDRLLIEFHPQDEYSYVRNAVDEVLGAGFTPVLAHVERFNCMVAEYDRASELRDMGCEIQMNAADYMGAIGPKIRKYLMALLDDGAIDYLGTDAHDSKKRIPDVRKCLKDLYSRYDETYIRAITYDNADRIFEYKQD